MVTIQRSRLTALAALVAISALCAGCGGGSSSSSTSTAAGGGGDTAAASSGGAGSLTHSEGAIAVSDGKVTVTGGDGRTTTYTLGSQVSAGQLAAFAASGEKVRVYTRGTTAVRVEKAPTIADTAPSVTGTITAVSPTSLTLDTKGGAMTFTIRPSDATAFDVPHLEEHQRAKSPITVYYEQVGSARNALAYEDA